MSWYTDTETVDQTMQVIDPPFSLLSFSLTVLGKLPWWVVLGLLGGLIFYTRKAVDYFRLQNKIGKYKLEKRRRHGIPDSDTRPFREAAAEALIKSREMVERRTLAGEAGISRTRKVKPQTPEKLRDTMSLVPAKETLSPQALAYASSSKYGSYNTGPVFDTPVYKYNSFGSGSILDRSFSKDFAERNLTASSISSSGQDKIARTSTHIPTVSSRRSSIAKPNRIRKRSLDKDDESEGSLSEEELHSKVRNQVKADGGRKRRKQVVKLEPTSEDDDDQTTTMEVETGPFSDEDTGSAMSDEDEGSISLHNGRAIDWDDNMMSSSSDEAERPSPPPLVAKKSTKQKRQISDVESVSSKRSFRKRTKSNAGGTVGDPRLKIDEEVEEEDVSEEDEEDESESERVDENGRKEGDIWNDPNGIRFRVGKNGTGRERLVLVKKTMRKYDMPIDSEHPDRYQTIVGNVEQWVTESEFAELKAQKRLAWQSDDDQDMDSRKERSGSVSDVGSRGTPLSRSNSIGSAESPGLYQRIGRSATPLRSSTSLADLRQSFSGVISTTSPSQSSGPGTPVRSASASDKLRMSTSSLGLRALYHSDFASKIGDGPKAAMNPRALGERERRAREAKMLDRLRAESVASSNSADKDEAPKGVRLLGRNNKSGTSSGPASPGSATPPPQPPLSTATPSASKSLPAPSFTSESKPAADDKPSSASSIPNFFAKPAVTTTASATSAAPSPATTSLTAPAPASSSNPLSFGASPATTPAVAESKPANTAPAPAVSAPSFSFGGPKALDSSAPSVAPSTGKEKFSFGAPAASGSTSVTTSTAAPAPSSASAAPTPAPKTPALSFGASNSTGGGSAGFSFGKSSEPAPPSKQSSFSFGASTPSAATSSTPAASSVSEPAKPSTPAFAFGAPSKPAERASSTGAASAPSFSFGSSSKPAVGSSSVAAPAAGSFSFGGASNATSAEAASSPASSFSFGAPKVAVSAPTTTAPASSFSFGAPSKVATPSGSTASSSAPSFSFGSTSSAPAPSSNPPGSGTSFASSTSGSAPAFSFGTSSTSTPPVISKPAFNFGASSGPAATSSTTTAAPAAFSFGAKPSGLPPTSGTGTGANPGAFNFGAMGGSAGSAGSMFSFGK